MAIFSIKNDNLSFIKEKQINLEKDIQKLTEKNMNSIFGLQFVRSEFALHNFRIDTLAFDKESKSFVIIEYKKDRNFSVIDQGYAYLALMLNNKGDFIVEYNEKTSDNLKRSDIDWSQSRVMFIANSYTVYQQNAINFKDLPIELWEVKMYDNNTVLYNKLTATGSTESIKTITQSNYKTDDIVKEIKVYTIEDHYNNSNKEMIELFEKMRERILSLGTNIREEPKKFYIAYKLDGNFVDILINRKKAIHIAINMKSGELYDPKNMAIDFTKPQKGHWGNGDYEVALNNEEDINYVMMLVEQSYKKAAK